MRKTMEKYCRCYFFAFAIVLLSLLPLTVVASQTSNYGDYGFPRTTRPWLRTKITYSCVSKPIETVLMDLAEMAKVDIVKSPKVTGDVTVKLTNVPLEEALTNILAAHDYTYIATENMIRVVPLSEVVVLSEQLVTRIYRVTYADPNEVASALRNFVSANGKVGFNKGTSHIMVTDTESKIKAIDKFIEQIDFQTPQVLVEVRIYDVTSKEGFELGPDWQVEISDTDAEIKQHKVAGSFDRIQGGTLSFSILNDVVDLELALNYLRTQVEAKLLANPRVLVLDNETAHFKSVREIPYRELRQIAREDPITYTEFKNVGVDLKVTPHVTRDGMLRLHIIPEFGVLVSQDKIGPDQIRVPTVDTRQADTIALIRDGQTIAIGGLRKRQTSKDITKVPVLADMPLLGGLFKSEIESVEINELVVFITTKIVTQPDLSETEKKQLDATEFVVPEMTKTKLEREHKQRIEADEQRSIPDALDLLLEKLGQSNR